MLFHCWTVPSPASSKAAKVKEKFLVFEGISWNYNDKKYKKWIQERC